MNRKLIFIIFILFIFSMQSYGQPPNPPAIVMATSGDHGSISPSGEVEVNPGENKTFTITPDQGYRIASVKVDDVAKGAIASYTFENLISGSYHTIHATFEAGALFTINATSGSHGRIDPAGEVKVPGNSNMTFNFIPDTNYRVLDVLVDGESIGAVAGYTFSNITANHTIHVTYDVNQYTITASASSNGNIVPSGEMKLAYGSSQKYLIIPDAGFHIANVIVDGSSVGTVTEYTFTNVAANHTINAVFEINQYTISATSSEHGSISPSGSIKVTHGSDKSLSIIPDQGYQIAGLIVDGINKPATNTYTFENITSDHYIHAIFEIKSYTIKATASEHGTISPSGDVKVPHGSDQRFVFTPAKGYDITNVFIDGVSAGQLSNYTFKSVSADHVLYASFDVDVYTINITTEGSGITSPSGKAMVSYGSDQSITITPALGFHVANVIVDGVPLGILTEYTFVNIVSDHTVNVKFEANTYTIKATAEGRGSISPSGNTSVKHGSDLVLSITPDAGYYASSLAIDGIQVAPSSTYTFKNITSDHTINVIFSPIVYTIASISGAHGSISPSGEVKVSHGASQKFVISPDTGYSVSDVKIDNISAGAITEYIFSNVTSDHTIRADFEINSYAIKATALDHGNIVPSGDIKINYGGSQRFLIAPDKNYNISNVYVDNKPVGAVNEYTFTNVKSDHTIQATFEIESYTITAKVNGNGSINPTGDVKVIYGSDATYTFTPDQNYRVVDVIIDGVSVGPSNSYIFRNVNQSHSINVIFDLRVYTIKATSGQYGNIAPSGEIEAKFGSDQSFTIVPLSGYHVSDVVVDGVSKGQISSYTFNDVAFDHTIAAYFDANIHKIKATTVGNGKISPSGELEVDYGKSITFSIAPDTGYKIADVIVDGKSIGVKNTYSFTAVSGNHTINAVFTKETYTILASVDGNGKIAPSGRILVEYGSDKSFSIIPDSGYYISDVNVDDKSVGAKAEYTFENVSDNHRIHAKFEAIQYTIRATANEHLNIKPSGEVKAKQGSGIAFTITADKGYRIGNVIVDGKSIGAVTLYEFINVTSDHTISAVTDGIEGMKGDVNGDGKIRANDAIMALRISTGQLIPTREQEYAADMNNDGRVRSNDAILILRKSVELE